MTKNTLTPAVLLHWRDGAIVETDTESWPHMLSDVRAAADALAAGKAALVAREDVAAVRGEVGR